MFSMTNTNDGAVVLRASFWQCMKAGIAFTLGAVAIPVIALIVQAVTKIPVVTLLALLPRL